MSLQIDKDGFPLVVKKEYRAVFDKFMETEVALALPTRELKAQAFISYMQKIDRAVKFNFDTTVDNFNLAGVKLIRLFLRRNGMLYGLAVKEFKGELHTDQNTFINALLNPAFVGICRFEDGRNSSVKNNLASMTDIVFAGRMPRQFEIPKKLKTVLASKTLWVRLLTNPMLEMAVYREAGRDGILIRYKLNISQTFFYGGKESTINKLQTNIKRQIMARRIYEGI